MTKVLILCEAERDENCPHPEVNAFPMKEWNILSVDSSLWLNKAERKQCQALLREAATIIKTAQERRL